MELSKIVNCLFWTTCQCIFSTGRAPAYGARAIVYCMIYIIFSRPAGQPHKLMIFTITPTCNRSYESHFRFSKQTHVLLQTVYSLRTFNSSIYVGLAQVHSNYKYGLSQSGAGYNNYNMVTRDLSRKTTPLPRAAPSRIGW